MTRAPVSPAPLRFLGQSPRAREASTQPAVSVPSSRPPPSPAEVWSGRLKTAERRVLECLRRQAGTDGRISLTHNEIAAGGLVARSQVGPALEALIRLRLVSVVGSLPTAGHPRRVYEMKSVIIEADGIREPV